MCYYCMLIGLYLRCITHAKLKKTFGLITGLCNYINTTDATSGAGTVNPFGALEFTLCY